MTSFIMFDGELLNLDHVVFLLIEYEYVYETREDEEQGKEKIFWLIRALDRDRNFITAERFRTEEKCDKRYAELKEKLCR